MLNKWLKLYRGYIAELGRAAYTIAEVIVVITIVGTMMAFAIPKFAVFMERMKSREGTEFLQQLYQAQKAYYIDENCPEGGGSAPYKCYKRGAAIVMTAVSCDAADTSFFCSYLTLDWPLEFKYFGTPSLHCADDPNECDGQSGPNVNVNCHATAYGALGELPRSGGPWNYTLWLLKDGRVVCLDNTLPMPDACEQGICKKMGFSDNW